VSRSAQEGGRVESLHGTPLPPGRGGQLAAPAAANRSTGLIVVVAVHVLFAWALASGLARQAIEIVKKPIQMVIVPEVAPPPPPPPKVEKIKEVAKLPPPPAYVPQPDAPVIQAPPPPITVVQSEPPKEPVVIAPPPPPAPAPVVAVAPPAPVKQEISLACPGYQNVLADTLEDAFDRVGIAGTVRSRITVRGNQVVDAVAVSGPKEYFKYVQAAIKRMRCSAGGAEEVQVALDVQFKR
jgi:protein TonB